MGSLPFDPIQEAARQWEARWGAAPVPSMAAVTSVMRVQQILIARLNEERFATAPLEPGELESLVAVLRRLRAEAGDF